MPPLEKRKVSKYKRSLLRWSYWSLGVLALKAVDTPFSIHQLLLAGIERVTGVTNSDSKLGRGRASRKGIPASSAVNLRFKIFGVNAFFHVRALKKYS
jgi:hypothetical protein